MVNRDITIPSCILEAFSKWFMASSKVMVSVIPFQVLIFTKERPKSETFSHSLSISFSITAPLSPGYAVDSVIPNAKSEPITTNWLPLQRYDFPSPLQRNTFPFKGLYKDISHYQKDELFVILDNYLKDLFKDDYEYLHYLLKIDYLENFKVRPKIWWKNPPLKKDVLFKYICSQNNDLSLELLYRYSIVITYNNLIYVIIYKDFKFSSFHFKY